MRFAPGLAPLRHRDFALYWSGLTVSQIGDWMETTTTAWLLYEITGSPLLLGLWGGIRAAAIVGFGLVGGAVADRFPRRTLLLITQSGFALTSLALFAFVATGTVTAVHIYVASAVASTLVAFDAPARRSMYPTLVPRSQLQNATTMNAAVFRVSRLAGPALAGVIIATLGPAASYLVNAVSSVAIIVALALMRARPVVARVRARLVAEMADGVRYTLRTPPLGQLLALETGHALFSANTALVTIFAKDVLGVGPERLGLLLAGMGGGALLATAAMIAVGDVDRKGRWMLIGGWIYAVAYAAVALSRSFELTLGALTIMGAADAYWSTMRTTIFQIRADDAYRGRTLAVLSLVGRGFTQASQLVTGVLVAVAGAPAAALLGSVVIAGSLGAIDARDPRVRRFRGGPAPDAAGSAASESPAP
ncbi:MAG TPA: MFS transporter [Candidatus Limnocylindria bacterium]|nr:MFS transporter [Candidatus Limnocylindria bacterium]